MFTGIVEEIGRVVSLTPVGEVDDAARLHIACTSVVADARIGDSIAVDGCCLTVTELTGDGFTADLMAETLRATGLGTADGGRPVNLERATRAGDRLGGHIVQGHVDGTGRVHDRQDRPGTVLLTFTAPPEVAPYLVAKGSVTVDGVSLTIVDVQHDGDGHVTFRVGVIPHTLEVTTLGARAVGDTVNLEADVIAKHVHHLLSGGASSPYRPAATPPPAAEPTGPTEPTTTTVPTPTTIPTSPTQEPTP